MGNSMPIAFAVLRLTTSSYLTGCSTGRSPGWAPLRILRYEMGNATVARINIDAVRHQPADFDISP